MNILLIFSALQIIIYLFIVPFIKVHLGDAELQYTWLVSVAFTMAFITGAIISLNVYIEENRQNSEKIEFKSVGKIYAIGWSLIVIYISFEYKLFNRRIGTDAAAELFSSIPIYTLVTFRSFEIALPFLMSILIINCIENSKIKYIDAVIISIFTMAFYSLGAAGSRSATLLLIINILFLVQNRIPRSIILKLGSLLIIISVLALSIVQINRLDDDDRTYREYATTEVIDRLDGMELLSKINEIHELKLTGINLDAAYNAIISLIPFLEKSLELKAEGLTSIKSVALDEELGSKERDHNSFIIFDIYYLFGLVGVVSFGTLLGFACLVVDKKIFNGNSQVGLIAIVSIGTNLIILEREFLGIVISIVRDFFIIYIVAKIFLLNKKVD